MVPIAPPELKSIAGRNDCDWLISECLRRLERCSTGQARKPLLLCPRARVRFAASTRTRSHLAAGPLEPLGINK